MLGKKERLKIFYKQLNLAPPVSNDSDAFTLLSDILNAVEDEHTSIPYTPRSWASDGRMYPPQGDSKRTETEDITRYRNRNHNTYVGSNGSIKIVSIRKGEVVLDKAGSDGRKVDEL